jgi:hypothetical protein
MAWHFLAKCCTVLSVLWLFWLWKLSLMEIVKFDLEIYYMENIFILMEI